MTHSKATDGIDHINVAASGRTMLGLMLHNGAYSPFIHPQFGRFFSISGLWGWYVTQQQYDIFRLLHSNTARETISLYPVAYRGDLKEVIESAIRCKIQQNLTLAALFQQNRLPLVSIPSEKPIYTSELEKWAMDDSWTIDILRAIQAEQQA